MRPGFPGHVLFFGLVWAGFPKIERMSGFCITTRQLQQIPIS